MSTASAIDCETNPKVKANTTSNLAMEFENSFMNFIVILLCLLEIIMWENLTHDIIEDCASPSNDTAHPLATQLLGQHVG
jgi:hypothetical protein